jgi:Bacterial PH domain
MPLVKITDMTYQRTVLGRLLGYGDLVLESAGQHQAFDSIRHLPHPDHFYKMVTELVTAAPALANSPHHSEPDHEDDDTGPIPRVIV